MIALLVVLALTLASGWWVQELVAADGRGQRPGPRSHRHEVDLDQHTRLVELAR